MTVAAGQRAQEKVPGERTREVAIDTGASTGTPVRNQGSGGSLPGPDAGHPLHGTGAHDDEDRGAEVPGVEREWEPRWEPRNERLPDCLDVPGQPTGTRPRSRTDLNGSGRPRGYLRVRRLRRRLPWEIVAHFRVEKEWRIPLMNQKPSDVRPLLRKD